MKKILLTLLLSSPMFLFAQSADTTYWKSGGVASIAFSQVSLSNWAGGGNNSVALNTYLNVFSDYAKDRIIWENSFEFGYGVIKQGKGDFVKSDDKINFNTKFGRQLKKDIDKLYLSALFNFRTQMEYGYNADDLDHPISKFMAPGYMTIAVGLDWKPSKYFSLMYAPLSGKITIVSDQLLADAGAFGVDGMINGVAGTGSKSRSEFGSYLSAVFKKEIVENVNLESKLQLFSNYSDDPGGIDVNWENALLMKINKYLTASLITQLIYDNDIKIEQFNDAGVSTGSTAKVQLKNIFGLGLAYNFGAKK